MERGVRVESSLPVQSRVSIVDLARLDMFWREEESVVMRSMSQLVSWSVSALCDLLEANGLVRKGLGVREAHEYLKERGLYQKSVLKRGRKKITAAVQLETLRRQGSDPETHAPKQHGYLHNKHSVKALSEREWREIEERVEREKVRERERLIKELMRNKGVKTERSESNEHSGIVVGKNWNGDEARMEMERRAERDRETLEEEGRRLKEFLEKNIKGKIV